MRQIYKVGGHSLLLTVVWNCFESLLEMSLWVPPVFSFRLKVMLGGVVQCLGDDVIRDARKDLSKFRHWFCFEAGLPILLG